MNEQAKPGADSSDVLAANFLRDPYLEWAKAEGVPIVEDFAVDLHEVKTARWERAGVPGAFVHLKGRGGAHSRPYRKIVAMHHAMWVFYRKHLRRKYWWPTTALVALGIGTSLATSLGLTWTKRLFSGRPA